MQARHEVTRKGWGVRGVGASIKTSRLESPKVGCLDQVLEVQRYDACSPSQTPDGVTLLEEAPKKPEFPPFDGFIRTRTSQQS